MTFQTFSLIGLLLAAPPAPTAKELNAQGFELYKQGDFQGAYAAFNEATRVSPSLAIALYNRAALASKLGDSYAREDLLADLQVSIGQDPARLARAKVDQDFDPIRTTLAFQRIIDAPDIHSVAGLTALLPKLSWCRALAERYSFGNATFRLLSGGHFEIDRQPAGTWKVVARPKRDPLIVIEMKEPAKTMTGQLLPDGRLVFDDEWWANERGSTALTWADSADVITGEDVARQLVDEALALEKKDARRAFDVVQKLLRAIDAAPRSARAYYELARVRGETADSCSDDTSAAVNELEAAFSLDPTLRERAKNDAGIARLGKNIAYRLLMGTDLRKPADVAALLPKLDWYFGPPSQSDLGWGLSYAFKPDGRFEMSERLSVDDDFMEDKRVGAWKVARAGNGVTVTIEVPASKHSKAAHLVGWLTRDGRLLFESQWWRSGFAECCC